jgi:hypothetical protein
VHSAVLPEGQLVEGQLAPLHVTSHAHESLQSTLLHALAALQSTVQRPSPHSIEEHALVEQLMSHDRASRQSIDEHAPGLVQAIVHAKSSGHSIELHWPLEVHWMLQVRSPRLQPALHSPGQSVTMQNPPEQVRPSVHCSVTVQARSSDFVVMRQLARLATPAAIRNVLTAAPSGSASRRPRPAPV